MKMRLDTLKALLEKEVSRNVIMCWAMVYIKKYHFKEELICH
jgi:hypothetical protein